MAEPIPASITALARQLLGLRDYASVRRFRNSLDAETARAVIRHPLITPADRGAISLLINFGEGSRYGQGAGAIVDFDGAISDLGFTLDPLEQPADGKQ
jgi:hypothetical protein